MKRIFILIILAVLLLSVQTAFPANTTGPPTQHLITSEIANDAPAWGKASSWAAPELQKADGYGLIPDILKNADMTKPITREEFCELALLLYEKTTGKSAAPVSSNPFTDTRNPQILKAFGLGITKGTSGTTFSPNKTITRQECATMLYRTIRIINPDGDYSISGVPDFPDQKYIDSWAAEGTKYMFKLGIIKGDTRGYFMPKAATTAQQAAGYGTATREAAVLMSVRTFDAMPSVASTPPPSQWSVNVSPVVAPSTTSSDSESLWSKYMAADGSISFYYPKGWNAGLDNSMIVIENPTTDEQMIMIMIPFDQYKSPQDLANGFLAMLKNGRPNICASNWRSRPESSDIQVFFDLTDNYNAKDYSGLGIVIKSDQQAVCFSYFAPASGSVITRFAAPIYCKDLSNPWYRVMLQMPLTLTTVSGQRKELTAMQTLLCLYLNFHWELLLPKARKMRLFLNSRMVGDSYRKRNFRNMTNIRLLCKAF